VNKQGIVHCTVFINWEVWRATNQTKTSALSHPKLPEKSMSDLWWINWQWVRIFSKYSFLSCIFSCQQCSILFFY